MTGIAIAHRFEGWQRRRSPAAAAGWQSLQSRLPAAYRCCQKHPQLRMLPQNHLARQRLQNPLRTMRSGRKPRGPTNCSESQQSLRAAVVWTATGCKLQFIILWKRYSYSAQIVVPKQGQVDSLLCTARGGYLPHILFHHIMM